MWNGSIQLGIQKEIQQNENGLKRKPTIFQEEITSGNRLITTRNE